MRNAHSFKHLILEVAEVSRVTLNRPDVRNAFNAELIAELETVFQGLGSEELCRV